MQHSLIPISKFCELTSLGRTTAFKLLRDGALSKVKVGGRTLIPLDSVNELIARSTIGGGN